MHNNGSSFLKIGITFANLHRSGKIPVLKDKLIISAKTSDKKLFEIFNV